MNSQNKAVCANETSLRAVDWSSVEDIQHGRQEGLNREGSEWPIPLLNHITVHAKSITNCQKLKAFKAFVEWMWRSHEAEKVASASGFCVANVSHFFRPIRFEERRRGESKKSNFPSTSVMEKGEGRRHLFPAHLL